MTIRNWAALAATAILISSGPALAKSSARPKIAMERHQFAELPAETLSGLDATNPIIWFRASVDAMGRVTNCSHTSAEPAAKAVGDKVCASWTRSNTAPFVPAFDAKGQPVASEWSLGITWRNLIAG